MLCDLHESTSNNFQNLKFLSRSLMRRLEIVKFKLFIMSMLSFIIYLIKSKLIIIIINIIIWYLKSEIVETFALTLFHGKYSNI